MKFWKNNQGVTILYPLKSLKMAWTLALYSALLGYPVSAEETQCKETETEICVAYDESGKVSFSPVSRQELRELEASCGRGEVDACREAAVIHQFAAYPSKDYERAAKLYGVACEAGIPISCDEAGHAIWSAKEGHSNAAQALKYWKEGCELGEKEACFSIATAYAFGVGGTPAQALTLLEKQCSEAHFPSCTAFGEMHRSGMGIDTDYQTSMTSFEKACRGGHLRGCVALGMMHSKGLGTDVNMSIAAQRFRQACMGGDAKGCGALGSYMYQGEIDPEDSESAVSVLRRSCNLGLHEICEALRATK